MLYAKRSRRGFIALISILIVISITLAIGLSVNMLGSSESQMGLGQSKSSESFYGADACMEEAFIRIKRNSAYAGGTLSIGENSCIIEVTADGDKRIVVASSNIDNFVKKIRAEITLVITPKTIKAALNKWEEITE